MRMRREARRSDETRRGRSLLVGTTNCPWRISAAMRSRFVIVPVLQPLEQDLPMIICAIVRRVWGVTLDPSEAAVVEAGSLLHRTFRSGGYHFRRVTCSAAEQQARRRFCVVASSASREQ